MNVEDMILASRDVVQASPEPARVGTDWKPFDFQSIADEKRVGTAWVPGQLMRRTYVFYPPSNPSMVDDDGGELDQ